jgi:hypothetical protein
LTTATRSPEVHAGIGAARGIDYLSNAYVVPRSWSYQASSTVFPRTRRQPFVTWSAPAQVAGLSYQAPIDDVLLVSQAGAGSTLQWLESTLNRVRALMSLDTEDTAGRDAPPSLGSVVEALQFLAHALPEDASPPSLAPLNDGGLQAEWHRGGLDVEVIFSDAEEERGIYVFDKATGVERELPLSEAAFAAAVGDRLNVTH